MLGQIVSISIQYKILINQYSWRIYSKQLFKVKALVYCKHDYYCFKKVGGGGGGGGA